MTLPNFLGEKQNISIYQEFHTWANEYGETIPIRLLLTGPEIIVDAMTFCMYEATSACTGTEYKLPLSRPFIKNFRGAIFSLLLLPSSSFLLSPLLAAFKFA